MFGAVKLTKNVEPDKCKYACCGTRFDTRGLFFFSDGSGFGKNIMILGADMRSLVHIDNKKKDLLIFGKNAAESLDDTVLTEDKENFTEQQKKF